jgi:Short C-terminal domain
MTMAATALYTVAMNQADAFSYTREALQASGVALGVQAPPSQLEFSLTRKDLETGSIDAVMPGRAVVAPNGDGKSTVTITVDPATQFIMYAVGIGLIALVFGGFFLGGLGGLWFLVVLAAEGYLFWSIFNKWPNDALAMIRIKMQASSAVTGGTPVMQPAAPIITPAPPGGSIFTPPPAASPAAANTADIAEKIRHLGELRDQGLITQEEFEAKKAELLKRI